MTTIQELTWQTLTATINEIKPNATLLQQLIFGREVTLPTETIELGFLTGGRQTAPFVRVNGEAIPVQGHGEKFALVKAPNIRIKTPLEPYEIMTRRRPGTVIFPTVAQQVSAMQQYIALRQQRMLDMIVNTKEYLCAQAIQGTITYSVEDGEVFQITYPKSSSHTITVSPYWDENGTPQGDPETDFRTVKRLMSEDVGLTPTIALFGQEASDAFMSNTVVRTLLDTRNYEAGRLTIESQYNDAGAIYLGRFAGIPCWEYSRQVEVDGVATDMIRSNYVEFINTSPAAENVMYYGAIPDMKALQGRQFIGRIFSKSWEEEDPSVRQLLVHTRPLPVPRKPDSIVSLKVVA